jgi:hypothetical protein
MNIEKDKTAIGDDVPQNVTETLHDLRPSSNPVLPDEYDKDMKYNWKITFDIVPSETVITMGDLKSFVKQVDTVMFSNGWPTPQDVAEFVVFTLKFIPGYSLLEIRGIYRL